MAEFDITTHSRKVLQIKKMHDEQIELLNQKLAKEVAQLHAEIPPEHKDNFGAKQGSKGKTGLIYPLAISGVAEPDWYQDALKVLDRATTNPNITFRDLVAVTGVKQPGTLLRHLMPTQKTDKTRFRTRPAKQFGGEKVITTGQYKPGLDYIINSNGIFSPQPMLGMPMYYKGKQIHLFPDLEAKFPEYSKKKITKAFKNQYKPLESVDHMKHLIQLVESLEQSQ